METEPQLPKIEITIRDSPGGLSAPEIVCSRPIPRVSVILPWFSKEEQALIRQWSAYSDQIPYVIGKLGAQLPYQRWADVIAQVLTVQERNKLGAHAEAPEIQVAYLAIGDAVYELSKARVIPPTEAQEQARQATLASTHRECASLLEAAQAEKNEIAREAAVTCQRLIREGRANAAELTQSATRARNEAQRLLNETRSESGKTPPDWMTASGSMIRYRGDKWNVRFEISAQLAGFDINYTDNQGNSRIFSWNALPTSRAKTVNIWVPIQYDGTYAITSLYVDSGSPILPHIHRESACMGPGDAPARITSLDDLNQLKAAVQRTMRRVQLDSLLVMPSQWRSAFKSAIPPDLYTAISRNSNYQRKIRDLIQDTLRARPEVVATSTVSSVEEDKFVWSTRS